MAIPSPRLALLASLCAWPASTLANTGFAARVTPEGLNWLANEALAELPAHFDLPEVERQVVNCPFTESDMDMNVYNGVADVEWRSLGLAAQDGGLSVTLSLDVAGDATVHVENPYACFGEVTCQVGLNAQSLDAALSIGLGTGPDGRIEAHSANVDIGINPSQFDLDISGCWFGDAAEWVFEVFEAQVLSQLSTRLQALAAEELPAALQKHLDQLGVFQFDFNTFHGWGWIESVGLSHQSGVTVLAEGGLLWVGEQPDCVLDVGPPDTNEATGDPLPESYGGGGFAVAASDARATVALYQVWRSGGLCSAIAARAAAGTNELTLSEDGLAQRLGLPAGTRVALDFSIDEPPRVEFGRDVADRMALVLDAAHLSLTVSPPDEPASEIGVSLWGARTDVALSVNRELGAITVAPKDLSVDKIDITYGQDRTVTLDIERVRGFLDGVVLPLLGERFGSVPITPAVFPIQETDVVALLRNVATDGGWLRAAVDAYRYSEGDDTSPPDTSLWGAPELVPAGLALIPVDGSDNETPTELLRYRATLDGQLLAKEPSFLRAVQISAADGDHVLEVAAVDLAEHVDPTPAVHRLVVDGIPPELTLLAGPVPDEMDDEIVVRWAARDDRTPTQAIETRWELRRLEATDDVGQVIAFGEFSTARGSTVLRGLDSDRLYVVKVVARDQAGNLTSIARGFIYQPGGQGCSCALGLDSRPQGFAWLLALAVMVLATTQRGRRSCA